jgi:uncharacterized protein (TIGR03435 family)
VVRMSLRRAAILPLLLSAVLHAQSPQPAFEAASVRPSQHEVGPDYNNQILYTHDGFNAKNATLRRLVAEAWHCQINQVTGPPWLDRNEYDIAARTPAGATAQQMHLMLRTLLTDRFGLKQHSEEKTMRVYALEAGKDGPKIQPVHDDAPPSSAAGFHFHGDMRQLADLLALQFSMPAAEDPTTPVRAGGPAIPVLDKTALQGTYDFTADIRPEPGTSAFTAWKRVLEDQLGLKIESRMDRVPIIAVDDALKTPTPN